MIILFIVIAGIILYVLFAPTKYKTTYNYKCSFCGHEIKDQQERRTDPFCPNCGRNDSGKTKIYLQEEELRKESDDVYIFMSNSRYFINKGYIRMWFLIDSNNNEIGYVINKSFWGGWKYFNNLEESESIFISNASQLEKIIFDNIINKGK